MTIINQPFSVLMSVYAKDKPEWLKEALDSVLSQTLMPSEILIAVDGPVPDITSDLLKEYASKADIIKNIFLPVNQGRGKALEETLPMCENELVALADADDINLPDRFEKQVGYFKTNGEISILGGQIEEVDSISLKPLSKRIVPLTDETIKKYLKKRNPFNQMTVMLKKQDVLKAGGYLSMHLFEDYYLWLRMAINNYKMANLNDTLVHARIDKNLYKRRGGYKYFKSNKKLQDIMLKHKLINIFDYISNIIIRFTIQVLMPNFLRAAFYGIALRK